MSNTSATEFSPFSIGGSIREHHWSWKGKPVTTVYEVLGEGKPILLLPSLSTVSSRLEMRGLAEQLTHKYQVFVLDWIGFGESSRPAIAYTPAVLEACLRDFVRTIFQEPVVVIAAGHAAGYVMQLAQRQPIPWKWVVLVSPTWRGPLPTMMNKMMGNRRWAYRLVQRLINVPILGQFLYSLTTKPDFLKSMYRRHVFVEEKNLTPDFMERKWQVTQANGARFGPAAFVTGGLDLVKKREDWFNWFQPLLVPVMMVVGEDMPPKSRQEVEILAHFSSVQVHRMPGSLGLHEEYPEQLAEGILPFLEKYLSRGR
ncbi:MAG: alpha/beta hydrolase [Myxacorys chilensis ATA2-1-KO14]|jgi:pimeloyl-ACP methyl ester carboxylesterase|nr:alpha/beta hydrolase [Myxacorys chilensis ATA2-1-KO14]